MFEQSFAAVLTIDLMTLLILKDKGIIEAREIQERLRQSKEKLAERYGEGPATQLIEAAMAVVAQGPGADVSPLHQ